MGMLGGLLQAAQQVDGVRGGDAVRTLRFICRLVVGDRNPNPEVWNTPSEHPGGQWCVACVSRRI
jgi:hypothetical protein